MKNLVLGLFLVVSLCGIGEAACRTHSVSVGNRVVRTYCGPVVSYRVSRPAVVRNTVRKTSKAVHGLARAARCTVKRAVCR